MPNTKIDFRAKDRQGGDRRLLIETPDNSILGIDADGEPAAMTPAALVLAQQRAGLSRVFAQTTFELLPALTSATAGNDPYFVTIGTGTEVPTRAATGGLNLKTQASTPADNDNAFLSPISGSAFAAVPVTAASLIVFATRMSVVNITKVVAIAGLEETLPTSNISPAATAGEGALFLFDPLDEESHGMTAANWVLAHKVNGVDTYASTLVPVVAGQDYELRIEVGADLKAKFYIDNVLVGTGPALTSADTVNAIAGVQMNASSGPAQKDLNIRYASISRAIG